jgi:DNA polymerase-3 subunit epsilon
MSPSVGRVIEVAAIRVEHNEITRTFNKLIDPGVGLSYFITNLTGITDDDLRGAPTFMDIADELHDVLSGALFIAHNVNFDYSFLKQEFLRAGTKYAPQQLCTVKLSRALYPEHKSHKLANLIERHGFTYNARHRAYDDAHVLWQFLQHTRLAFTPDILHTAVTRQLAL